MHPALRSVAHRPASREVLRPLAPPTFIMHGDDDQIVPIGASAMMSSKLVKGAVLKIHPGAPHGTCSTREHEINADLLDFFKKSAKAAA